MSVKVEIVEKNVTAKKEKGSSLVEYALLVALIAVASITAMSLLKNGVSSSFSSTANQLG